MTQILSKSIVLTGIMGCGKTTIGKLLSGRLGTAFSDTDKVIEEEVGKSVFEIFNDYGEQYFRQVEEKVVGKILDKTAHIISTGGGSILSSKTRNAIKLKSFSIWVKCDIHIISNRILNQGKRPLLKNGKIIETLIKKNEERIRFYRQADSHIVNNNPNVEMTIENIVKNLSSKEVLLK